MKETMHAHNWSAASPQDMSGNIGIPTLSLTGTTLTLTNMQVGGHSHTNVWNHYFNYTVDIYFIG